MPVKYIFPTNHTANQNAHARETVRALNKKPLTPATPVVNPPIKKQVKFDCPIEYFGNILK
jgi:hypothetical protein